MRCNHRPHLSVASNYAEDGTERTSPGVACTCSRRRRNAYGFLADTVTPERLPDAAVAMPPAGSALIFRPPDSAIDRCLTARSTPGSFD